MLGGPGAMHWYGERSQPLKGERCGLLLGYLFSQ